MTSWQLTRLFAGLMVLISLALGAPGSPLFMASGWLWLAAIAGIMMFQSGITRFCLLEVILRKLGCRNGA